MSDAAIRRRARAYGVVRENPLVRNAAACAHLALSALPGRSTTQRLLSLSAAARLAGPSVLRGAIRQRLLPWLSTPAADQWRDLRVGYDRYGQDFGDVNAKELRTSIVLKAPGANGEKGVLYSSFEYNWMRLVHHARAREFFKEWYLVGASSWSPGDYVSFGHLSGLSEDPVFIGVSHLSDVEKYRIAEPAIRALPLMACDWVDPDFYQPRPARDREIDILMVANWMRFKRHWLLFEALREMPKSLRVVLVGRNAPGRTEREVREEARAFGVPQDLEYHTDIDPQMVSSLQCNARISVICSKREGSCVAPVESMFADAPVAMFNDAHVGSTAHINAHTGILATRRGFARQLTKLLERAADLSPRRWAMENVSCHTSSAKLNRILSEYARSRGQAWTTDIAPLAWRYVPCHVHAADAARLQPAVAELRERFGVILA